ncbi:hypothetical protein SAMN06265355_10153 [Actinomadura mexicana]|uniref:Uncharacterized protein n=1 Tax=Actinomadura mexicana TaxID=134959 RepID=A0A238ULB0_9ACTN|nr:hypothetical protein SAMN06265355_10153 [Actinomadura mexicana]
MQYREIAKAPESEPGPGQVLLVGVRDVLHVRPGRGELLHASGGAADQAAGAGAPGAIAEYLLVDGPRHLVPLGGLDPVASVPLTDAG